MRVLDEEGKYRIIRKDELLLIPGKTNVDDPNHAVDAGFTPQVIIEVQQHIRIACIGMWICIKRWVHNSNDRQIINYNNLCAKELFEKLIE